jgi:branched-chain amino acid aminotransferase
MPYINYNGNIYDENEPLFNVTNRGFRYGDGFFESIVMFSRKMPLFVSHYDRILASAEIIDARLPEKFDEDYLLSLILDLASANDFSNARIRVQFYRKGDGLYLPETDELGFVVSMTPLNNSRFEIGEGLSIGVFPEPKPVGAFSFLKTTGALYYVMAAKWCHTNSYTEAIITNDEYDAQNDSIIKYVSEAVSSNVLMYTDNKLFYTADLDFAVNGIMQQTILSLENSGIEILEARFDVDTLANAEEILLVNAVKGVRWAKYFHGREYGSKQAQKITGALNTHYSL